MNGELAEQSSDETQVKADMGNVKAEEPSDATQAQCTDEGQAQALQDDVPVAA